MTTLYICGAGNPETVRLAQRVNQKERRWKRIVLLDDDARRHGRSILGVTIEGPFGLLEEARGDESEVVNAITRTTGRRWSVRRKLEPYGLPFATLIDTGVDLDGAELRNDLTIYQNATIGPESSIGETSAVFMGAVVGHESHVGRCCVVAANAVLNARVQMGDGVYVGSNASILPEVKIGAWATVAAGSMVMQNVPAGATVMGVPGKIVYRLSAEQIVARDAEFLTRALPQERGSGVVWGGAG